MALFWIALGAPRGTFAATNQATDPGGGVTLTASGPVTVIADLINPNNSSVTISPPTVLADGVAVSTITVILRDSLGNPVSGRTVSFSSSRGAVDSFIQPPAPTDASGRAVGTVRSSTPGAATITATETTNNIAITMWPTVAFTQGTVLELAKSANQQEVVVGDVVTYLVEIKNRITTAVSQVRVDDQIPPNFKYLKGSARLNKQPVVDPPGNRPLTFDIGTVPGLVDGNGNGQADPGEPGYLALTYQLVVGSGAAPREYRNTAFAKDVCDACVLSNTVEARVTVGLDAVFDLGTIIGKVFEDRDQNGRQDRGEAGIAGAVVVLDDGTSAITDEYGRYHFPAVRPGQRLVKINLGSLGAAVGMTTEEARVASVTPGLLAKVNFGVVYRRETEKIGSPGEIGLLMQGEENAQPIEVVGSVETLTVLINGQKASIPSGDIRMGVERLEEIVNIRGDRLTAPVEFRVEAEQPEMVRTWRLTIMDSPGETLHAIEGRGGPPEVIRWDGRTDHDQLVKAGEVYQYQIMLEYADGSRSTSARRVFGVNRTAVISLNLTGGVFASGSVQLTPKARAVLRDTAQTLRKFPREKILVEGHADATGSPEANLVLSRKRAEAAVAYLVNDEKIPAKRFLVRWYGATQPIASNAVPEGRELNRRVEIKGEAREVERSRLLDQYRTDPVVRINRAEAQMDPQGRFAARVTEGDTDQVEIELVNPQGRLLQTTVRVPHVEILEPKGELGLPYGVTREGYRTSDLPRDGRWRPGAVAMVHRLIGRTEPDNVVTLDGTPLKVESDGTFRASLELGLGDNSFGLLVQNPAGYTRIVNLIVTVSDRDQKGLLLLAVPPIPHLTVELPPGGGPLRSSELTLAGETDAGNQVEVNGRPVVVEPDGHFRVALKLPEGKSRLVMRVTDPEGHTGTIERGMEVPDTHLFFLAIADGKVGQLRGKGYLAGAGMDAPREYYTEGRVAYYLKGVIAGRYLIASAFDTGTREFSRMFQDLDAVENDRLFTNLDPDKIYPVYGDSSTLVHDAESQGKFYLVLDSEEFHLLIGNYPLHLTDTELGAYQRTLYGGRIAYRSLSRTRYGQPDTSVVLFGAEVRQAHVRDELRATGGSLYYLSQRPVVEGSEQVAILIRDKNSGLPLTRLPQQQNIDYMIKYEEGRILFHRPIASVAEAGTLVDQALLVGNPVFLQVDYETRLDAFEKTAAGARVRQQIGDHVAAGATYVKDELTTGRYELKAVDGELRVGKNTRLRGEYAESSGTDSLVFTSDDGGLSYTPVAPTGLQEGRAWKAATELDLGEWWGAPDRLQVGGYIKRLEAGFVSSGNLLDSGRQKRGADLKLAWTGADKIVARYDREDATATGTNESERTMVQWRHDRDRWGLTGEYQDQESLNAVSSSFAAARLRLGITEKLATRLERQETITGPRNDQTRAGLEYRMLPFLTFQASGTHGTLGQAAQVGLVAGLGNRRLYLTERVADDAVRGTSSTVMGGETTLGLSSRVYSEYQWEHSDEGGRVLSLTGAQRQWDLTEGMKVLLAGEHSRIDSGPTVTRRYTLATGLSYVPAPGVSTASRSEVRLEQGGQERVQYFSSQQVGLQLHPDFTLIGKYRYSVTRDLALGGTLARFEERSAGLAYRPVASDRFHALARYTRLLDQPPAALSTTTDVASIEWLLELHRRLEWVEKEAGKFKAEEGSPAVKTHTYLSIHRMNLRLWKALDAGLEYRTLRQKEAADRRQGWLAEITWETLEHLRLGTGYNFTDFSDNEFSDHRYSVHGWFIRLQAKF